VLRVEENSEVRKVTANASTLIRVHPNATTMSTLVAAFGTTVRDWSLVVVVTPYVSLVNVTTLMMRQFVLR
jgi:hypothetical protein